MEALIGAAGAIAAAALTPGPNNFVVMRTAARGGVRGALPAIAGVALGSLALLAVVVAGAGAVFDAEPRLRAALAVAGALYLVYLGARLLAGGSGGGSAGGPARAEELPAGVAGLFGFQFLNPKSWVLALTATAATPAGWGALARFGRLAALFAVIPTACLLLWAALGAATAATRKRLSGGTGGERPHAGGRAGAWLDRALGGLLIASALLLLMEAWKPF
jgi:threonine/homoserine/homoserine lactone efflux protein